MGDIYRAICNFTGGEFSPQMKMRTDVPEYNNAVETEQNFYTLIQGAAKKRRGQAFVQTLPNSAQEGYIFPYILNLQYSYLVVINNGTMTFIKNGNAIAGYSITCPYTEADLPFLRYAQSGSIIYLSHPDYPIFSLQSYGDTNWVLSPTQFTYNATSDVTFSNAYINFKIINGSVSFGVGTRFTINQVNGLIQSYTATPTLPYVEISQPINLRSDGNNYDIATGGVGTATAPIIMDGIIVQVDNYVLLADQTTTSENGIYQVNAGAWTRATFYDSIAEINDSLVHVNYGLIWGNQYFNQTATIATVGVESPVYEWSPTPPGNGLLAGVTSQLGAVETFVWTITCLSASPENQTWEVIGTPASGTTAVVPTYVSATQFTVPGDWTSYYTKYQVLQFDNPTTLSLTSPPVINSTPRGYVTASSFAAGITTVTVSNFSSQVIPASLTQVGCVYTSMWKPGAYPNCLCFHDSRLLTGGSAQFPQFVWGSRAGGYFLDFTNGLTADMGVIEEIAGNSYSQILHLISSRQLLIMTSSSEYAMFGPSAQPISGISSNIVKDYTRHGCAVEAHPIRIGDEILFVQRDTLKTRAISYKIQGDTNVAPDITLFSNHLTLDGGIIAATFAQNPDYIAWFVTEDGRMLSCAYDRDQNIIAWSEHNSVGLYEGICTVPGMSSDYTYVIMKHIINGLTVRTIELMDYSPGLANTLGGPSFADCFFTETSASPTNIITGLPSFMYNASGVMVVANGTVVSDCVVSGTGTINLGSVEGTYFVIGFPYTATIKTLVPEFGDVNNTTLARMKTNSRIYVNVQNTTDLVFNPGQEDEDGTLISPDEDIPFLTFNTGLNSEVTPFSGMKEVQSSGWKIDNQVYIKSPNPTECIILGIIYRTSLGND